MPSRPNRIGMFLLSGLFSISLWFAPVITSAEVLRYTDDQGLTHYVDQPEKVPERFRGSVVTAEGKLSKMPAREFESVRNPSLTSPSKRVEIYVTNWCPHCRHAEAYLKERNIAYTRYDVEHDEVGKRKFAELGGRSYPLIKIGSKMILGFDQEALEEALPRRD